jgi:hypothetical protein
MQRRKAYLEWAGRVVDNCRGAHANLERYFDETVARGAEVLEIDG